MQPHRVFTALPPARLGVTTPLLCAAVQLDGQDDNNFRLAPGQGVLVNGLKGRASNPGFGVEVIRRARP